MNDSRPLIRTQLSAPFGVGIAVALLHGWVSTSDWPINWATESTLAPAFGTGCGLVLLGLRKRLAPRRSGNAEAPHER